MPCGCPLPEAGRNAWCRCQVKLDAGRVGDACRNRLLGQVRSDSAKLACRHASLIGAWLATQGRLRSHWLWCSQDSLVVRRVGSGQTRGRAQAGLKDILVLACAETSCLPAKHPTPRRSSSPINATSNPRLHPAAIKQKRPISASFPPTVRAPMDAQPPLVLPPAPTMPVAPGGAGVPGFTGFPVHPGHSWAPEPARRRSITPSRPSPYHGQRQAPVQAKFSSSYSNFQKLPLAAKLSILEALEPVSMNPIYMGSATPVEVACCLYVGTGRYPEGSEGRVGGRLGCPSRRRVSACLDMQCLSGADPAGFRTTSWTSLRRTG